MKGFVALLCWFQSKFVSASPIRLGSRVFTEERVDESSHFVAASPLQFWKMIRRVFFGRGVVGMMCFVMSIPVDVVMRDGWFGVLCELEGRMVWLILGNRRSRALQRYQGLLRGVSRLCRFGYSQGCSYLV